MSILLTIFAGIIIALMCVGIYIVNAAEQKERYKDDSKYRNRKVK